MGRLVHDPQILRTRFDRACPQVPPRVSLTMCFTCSRRTYSRATKLKRLHRNVAGLERPAVGGRRAVMAAKAASDVRIAAAQAATVAAAGTPGLPAAKAAEEVVKAAEAAQMAASILSASGGASIHACVHAAPFRCRHLMVPASSSMARRRVDKWLAGLPYGRHNSGSLWSPRQDHQG